jgi:hypothetical protein
LYKLSSVGSEEELKPIIQNAIQNSGKTNVTYTFSHQVPEHAFIDKIRLEKIIVNVLRNFNDTDVINFSVNAIAETVADGILLFLINVPLPENTTYIINSKYVTPSNLQWQLSKKLCEFFGGYMRVLDYDKLEFAVRFKFSSSDNVFKDKRIALLISDSTKLKNIYDSLRLLDANVSIINQENENMYLRGVFHYDLAIMDKFYGEKHLTRFRNNRIPVIGIVPDTNILPFDSVIPDIIERNILDEYKKILA